MKNMKKQLACSVLCLALLLIMMLSTTVAWFTDDVANVNTMVVGKISIEQKEYNDKLHTTEFENDKYVMMPSQTVIKEVVVSNNGNQPAYVRTVFAFEDKSVPGTDKTLVDYLILGDQNVTFPVDAQGNKIRFTIGEVTYVVASYVHTSELAATGDASTYTCLKDITLDNLAPNGWQEAAGTHYEILVLSQAVQTAGMTNGAAKALDDVFGVIDATNANTWFTAVLNAQ